MASFKAWTVLLMLLGTFQLARADDLATADTIARMQALEEKINALEHQLRGSQEKRNRQLTMIDTSVIDSLATSIDTVWIMAAGLICFFLQAGFGCLEAGAVRAKNAKNIMLKNLMDAVVGGVTYYLVGWGLAYGDSDTGDSINPYIGWGNFALSPAKEQDYLGWFFQYVFAATIATIVSGAVAERIQFRAYMIYSVVLVGFVYPVAAHWIWDANGFLYKWGVIDYAGGGAVHALSGVAAFMGALALGPRHGRFDENGKPVEIVSHDVVMMALGVFILWFGFVPFNAGSGLSVIGSMAGQTSRIAVITMLGGCSGAMTGLILGYIVFKHASVEYVMNGILAGMVTVCSCCAVCQVWHIAFIISPCGALSYFGLAKLLELIKVDDPLGAGPLHYGPGIVGLLAAGLFASPEYVTAAYGCSFPHRLDDGCKDYYGLFMGGTGKQFGLQVYAGVCWTIWGAVTCGILFFSMKAAGILRVSLDDELRGLDVTHHGGPAYSPEKAFVKDVDKTSDGSPAEVTQA
mmetsp:Transcript_29300/g.68198  ORF Transcript_29300/g.68198 Transcript_29300/m.68198 type:complete len:519 (+) Transcript_29300:62-1618(+)